MAESNAPRRLATVVFTVLALVTSMLAYPGVAAAAPQQQQLPIVFVHGGAGSAQQYQSQAMRFDSNGYAAELIHAFEYNSASLPDIIGAPAALDQVIDDALAAHGAERVHLVGHSLGTSVSGSYLAQPARAAKVASYVGVDGAQGDTCPGGVPCLGIFANTSGRLGDNNVHLPDQTHVEAATSPESFAAQYEFFTGSAPETILVLPERPGRVEISGRAVNFPANSGLAGATVRLYKVHPVTGARKGRPRAVFEIGNDGQWGPVKVNGRKHYEFEVTREGMQTGHIYFQPFIRSSHFVRLLQSPPGSGILANTNTGDGHAAAVVSRQREWWATRDAETGGNDRLWISTSSRSGGFQPPVPVLDSVDVNGTIGIHVHDDADTPGESTGELLPYFPAQAFQTGVDVFMPAASRPDGTISFANAPRGDTSQMQVVNVRNWASSEHRITVNFNDYVQDINSWGECKRARLC